MTLGGRLAEELIFGEDLATTGASNDIEQVANIAKRMVKEWGMSSKVGTVVVSTPQQGGFMQPRSPWGLQMLGACDSEVERLANNSYIKAKEILNHNMDLLHHLSKTLVDQEVVSAEEFIMMQVQFNVKISDYGVIGQERNRESLHFNDPPLTL